MVSQTGYNELLEALQDVPLMHDADKIPFAMWFTNTIGDHVEWEPAAVLDMLHRRLYAGYDREYIEYDITPDYTQDGSHAVYALNCETARRILRPTEAQRAEGAGIIEKTGDEGES